MLTLDVTVPPRCSYHELLASFRDIGKVQSTHITPPGDGHRTSCAKVAFYTRAAAEKLYAKIRDGEIVIRGYKLRCVWNRVKGKQARKQACMHAISQRP